MPCTAHKPPHQVNARELTDLTWNIFDKLMRKIWPQESKLRDATTSSL